MTHEIRRILKRARPMLIYGLISSVILWGVAYFAVTNTNIQITWTNVSGLATILIFLSLFLTMLAESKLARGGLSFLDYSPERVLLIMPTKFRHFVPATSFMHGLDKAYGVFLRRSAKIDLLVRSDLSNLLPTGDHDSSRNVINFHRDQDDLFGIRETRLDRLAETIRVAREVRQREYQLVINLSHQPRMGILTMCARVPKRVGFRSWPTRNFLTNDLRLSNATGESSSDYLRSYADFHKKIGGDGKLSQTFLQIPDTAKSAVSPLLEHKGIVGTKEMKPLYVLITPGRILKDKKDRQWPPKHYAALTALLSKKGEHGLPFLFLFGPGEQELEKSIREALKDESCHFISLNHQEAPLSVAAAVIKDALLIISNDSCPLQLAANFGTRALALSSGWDQPEGEYGRASKSTILHQSVYAQKGKVRTRARRDEIDAPLHSVDYAHRVATELLNRAMLDFKINRLRDDITKLAKQNNLPFEVVLSDEITAAEEPCVQDEGPEVEGLDRLGFMYLLDDRTQKASIIFNDLPAQPDFGTKKFQHGAWGSSSLVNTDAQDYATTIIKTRERAQQQDTPNGYRHELRKDEDVKSYLTGVQIDPDSEFLH